MPASEWGGDMASGQPRWGIPFARPAAASGALNVLNAPVPERLILPVQQHAGLPAEVCVATGDQVLKGQPLTTPGTAPSAIVHASSSGTVAEISSGPVTAGPDGLRIVLETDGTDTAWTGYPARAPDSLRPDELRAAVTSAGIVGLGGALFPTDLKLTPGCTIHTLILNGVECEPRISCDDALMRDQPEPILLGAELMQRALGAERCLVAVKAATPAYSAMQAAIEARGNDAIRAVGVPAIYPAGGEDQLIELLLQTEVPAGGLPRDTGVVCQNVGTAAALARFVTAGEPLIDRIVSVSGQGIQQPVNIRARIGTPISVLMECAGGYTDRAERLIMGGPMMGIALPDDALPITKGTNSLYVAAGGELAIPGPEMPCIRCGECATVCPVNLMPQLMLAALPQDDFDRLQQLGLPDCVECGCCDFVCPSHIPLTQRFVEAKAELRTIEFEQHRAALADARHSARQQRLEKWEAEAAAELDAQTEELADSPENARDALAELLKRTASKQRGDKDS